MSRPTASTAFVLLLVAGCVDADDADDTPVPSRPESLEATATLAATSAIDSSVLLGDIGWLIAGRFGDALSGGGFTSDTLRSGRHAHGDLTVRFGGACGLGGLAIDFDLQMESQPGAGDAVQVKGHVGLKHAGRELFLATTLDQGVAMGSHQVRTQIAACMVLDGLDQLLAVDGVVALDVDGALVTLFSVSDLQHLLCQPVPYTGTLHVQHGEHIIDVVFDRDTPATGVVTVVSGARTVTVKLPIAPGGTCTGGQVPVPADIEYATCGGCGTPVLPDGQ